MKSLSHHSLWSQSMLKSRNSNVPWLLRLHARPTFSVCLNWPCSTDSHQASQWLLSAADPAEVPLGFESFTAQFVCGTDAHNTHNLHFYPWRKAELWRVAFFRLHEFISIHYVSLLVSYVLLKNPGLFCSTVALFPRKIKISSLSAWLLRSVPVTIPLGVQWSIYKNHPNNMPHLFLPLFTGLL